MIIDVTDPANPKEMSHIPVPVTGGQAQMVRHVLGLRPAGRRQRARFICCATSRGAPPSGYEVWDVTDVKKPVLAEERCGAFAPHIRSGGSATPASPICRAARTRYGLAPRYGVNRSRCSSYDWNNPHNGCLRFTSALSVWPGGQPGATGAGAHLAPWCDLGARASQCGQQAQPWGNSRRHHREPHLREHGASATTA